MKTKSDNSFDQICINYTNERLQHLFIDLVLQREKHYYDAEKLDVPFVPFFDNGCIIGRKNSILQNYDNTYGQFMFKFKHSGHEIQKENRNMTKKLIRMKHKNTYISAWLVEKFHGFQQFLRFRFA